jgi:hypothetical protein
MVATVEPSSSISTQPERGERLLRYLIFQSLRQPKPNTEWRCHGEQYSGPTLTDLVGVVFQNSSNAQSGQSDHIRIKPFSAGTSQDDAIFRTRVRRVPKSTRRVRAPLWVKGGLSDYRQLA